MVDAGPLIALLNADDRDHEMARRGFLQLAAADARLIAPLPIAFEVYKWALYHAGASTARLALARMQAGLDLLYPDAVAFADVATVVEAMPQWSGSLEDALVAVTALHLTAPAWTLNYRDLSAFGRLEFWSPR